LLIWFLVGSFVRSSVDVISRNASFGIPTTPQPEDGRPMRCVSETTMSVGSSKTSLSFNISANAPHIYLFSRGRTAAGTVIVEAVDKPGSDITVDIDIEYWDKSSLWLLNVCLLEGENGGQGIGIYSPTYRWPGTIKRSLDFTIKYQIPTAFMMPGIPFLQKINSFETDLSNFKHHFGNLDGRVSFNDIHISTSNAHITAKSIDVVSGRFETSNAAITGKFSANKSLTLRTSNGRIEAEFFLTNEYEAQPVMLNARTSNGRILSDINLISKASLGGFSGGAFDVTTRTSNAQVELKFPKAPVDSKLNLKSKTSNAQAEISLHRTYEGTFELETSNSDIIINDGNFPDPKGQGRKHYIDLKKYSKRSASGEIRWGSKLNQERGTVVSSTSNDKLSLDFV